MARATGALYNRLVRKRWFSPRAFFLHFLLVTVVPGCFIAGWWQVNVALSGNLLSYLYSVEWPLFGILGVIAWWQLVHDERVEVEHEKPARARRSFLHRDDELPSPVLVWDSALETPELAAYNQYLRALSAGRCRKTWSNPRGLPLVEDDLDAPAGRGAGPTTSVSAL